MKSIASKVDNSTHEQVISRCSERGCSPSEYIRSLIQQDLGKGGQKEWPTKEGIPIGKVRSAQVVSSDEEPRPKLWLFRLCDDGRHEYLKEGKIHHTRYPDGSVKYA